MPTLSYEIIKPLIRQEDVNGASVQVLFVCPVSEEEVAARGTASPAGSQGAGSAIKQNIWRQMRWSLSRVIRSVMGYGVAGQIGAGIADTAMASTGSSGFTPKREQIEQAVVDAFKTVSARFAWDGSAERFVSAKVFKDLQTEFAVMLQETSFDKPWDRSILARILAEIAAADGEIAEEERVFFHSFTGGEGKGLDALLAEQPLTGAELQETTAKVRPAMLALAYAVALSDEQFAANEAARIATIAQGLGIAERDSDRLRGIAAEFVVDQAMEGAYADGVQDAAEREKVADLATALGLSAEQLQRLDARCRKRKGLL